MKLWKNFNCQFFGFTVDDVTMEKKLTLKLTNNGKLNFIEMSFSKIILGVMRSSLGEASDRTG